MAFTSIPLLSLFFLCSLGSFARGDVNINDVIHLGAFFLKKSGAYAPDLWRDVINNVETPNRLAQTKPCAACLSGQHWCSCKLCLDPLQEPQ